MHRTGRHDLSIGPKRRRCLTVSEMEAKGMKRNRHGYWTTGEEGRSWPARTDQGAPVSSPDTETPIEAGSEPPRSQDEEVA